MKKLLTIVTSIGLALALTGCKKKKLKIDLKDKGTCIGNGYERYKWDSDLNCWKPIIKYEKITDEDNKTLYEVSYMWYKKHKWTQLMGKTEYVYDEKGLLIKKLDSSDWGYNTLSENNRMKEYFYDGNVLVSMKESTPTLGIVSVENYTYDAKGNLSIVIVGKNEGTPSYKREYVYNENNLITKTLYYEYDGPTQSYKDPIDEKTYEYDEHNNLITYCEVNTLGYTDDLYGGCDTKTVRTYDKKNRMIEASGYIIEKGTEKLTTKITYEYFDNGNLKSETVSILFNGEWVLDRKLVFFTTIYND